MLRRYQRVPLLALNLLVGLFPSAAFFAWVERGCALPFLALRLDWPWISLLDAQLWVRSLWNVGLFSLFGVIHSWTAQTAFRRAIETLFPPQATRSLYLAICGASVTALMGLWQPTGVVLWQAPLSRDFSVLLSMALYYAFASGPLLIMQRFDPYEFLGLRQIYQSREALSATPAPAKLHTDGVYGLVRHPIYLFTLLAFILTPIMTLDRGLVIVSSLLYLAWGIPLEERKLLALFGPAYAEYRGRVPAVFPRFPFSKSAAASRIKS